MDAPTPQSAGSRWFVLRVASNLEKKMRDKLERQLKAQIEAAGEMTLTAFDKHAATAPLNVRIQCAALPDPREVHARHVLDLNHSRALARAGPVHAYLPLASAPSSEPL